MVTHSIELELEAEAEFNRPAELENRHDTQPLCVMSGRQLTPSWYQRIRSHGQLAWSVAGCATKVRHDTRPLCAMSSRPDRT